MVDQTKTCLRLRLLEQPLKKNLAMCWMYSPSFYLHVNGGSCLRNFWKPLFWYALKSGWFDSCLGNTASLCLSRPSSIFSTATLANNKHCQKFDWSAILRKLIGEPLKSHISEILLSWKNILLADSSSKNAYSWEREKERGRWIFHDINKSNCTIMKQYR